MTWIKVLEYTVPVLNIKVFYECLLFTVFNIIYLNIYTDDESSENSGDSSDSDELGDEDLSNGEITNLAEDRIPPEVMEAIISLEIFDKVWTKTQLPAENVLLILKEYEGSKSIFKK